MELDGVALDLRHQEVVLELLDERVQQPAPRRPAPDPAVAASRTAGTAEMIGPMIGTSSRMPAITDRRSAYRPKIGSTSWLRMSRPMNVSTPTDEAEDQLAADPLAEDPLDRPDDRPDVEPPASPAAPIERRDEWRPVLEQVERPRPAGSGSRTTAPMRLPAPVTSGSRNDRSSPPPALAAGPTPAIELSIQLADRERDLEMRVEVAESAGAARRAGRRAPGSPR